MYSNEKGKKEKEGGMNSVVFNAASFHNDLQVSVEQHSIPAFFQGC